MFKMIRHRMMLGLGLLVAVVAAFAVAGCGGGGSSDEAVTKAEFVKRGNAICQKQRRVRIRAFRRAEPSESEFAQFVVEESVPPYKQMINELEEMPAPAGDEPKLDKIFAAMRTTASGVAKDMRAALPKIERSTKAVRGYGLVECKF